MPLLKPAEQQIEHHTMSCASLPATVSYSVFVGASGTEEYELVVEPTRSGDFETQLDWLDKAYSTALIELGLTPDSTIVRRFYVSDVANQTSALQDRPFSQQGNADNPCAVSWIQQPSTPPAKVACWATHLVDKRAPLKKVVDGASLALKRGPLTHYWTTGLTSLGRGSSSHDQARSALVKYDAFLRERGMTLADHVVRTWFFVRDIDANYQGLVEARRELFARRGLTPETHFIASTGIEGAHPNPEAKVTLDAYAVAGLQPDQVEYLSALDHLSPTHVYGVTFERGTAVAWRDRRHVMISGTASIDRDGQIVHPGNVSRQLDRTLENIAALLSETGATLNDMTGLVTYVRDPIDQAAVRSQLRERFGPIPTVVVTASVCRPGWLVEIEGRAILAASNPELPEF